MLARRVGELLVEALYDVFVADRVSPPVSAVKTGIHIRCIVVDVAHVLASGLDFGTRSQVDGFVGVQHLEASSDCDIFVDCQVF